MAFWGVVVLFYLFSHLDLPDRRSYSLFLIIAATSLWMVSAITSHNLGRFVISTRYSSFWAVFGNTDFWYAYICAEK